MSPRVTRVARVARALSRFIASSRGRALAGSGRGKRSWKKELRRLVKVRGESINVKREQEMLNITSLYLIKHLKILLLNQKE